MQILYNEILNNLEQYLVIKHLIKALKQIRDRKRTEPNPNRLFQNSVEQNLKKSSHWFPAGHYLNRSQNQ